MYHVDQHHVMAFYSQGIDSSTLPHPSSLLLLPLIWLLVAMDFPLLATTQCSWPWQHTNKELHFNFAFNVRNTQNKFKYKIKGLKKSVSSCISQWFGPARLTLPPLQNSPPTCEQYPNILLLVAAIDPQLNEITQSWKRCSSFCRLHQCLLEVPV